MAQFSPQQQAFIGTYAKLTGLNPGVVSAQVAAEEPVGAKSGYAGTQNWLNIGITDSGPRGAGNPAWKDPVKAAELSAAWALGKASVSGFGVAAPSIQNAIKSTVGKSPAAQIAALQNSGWASSHYPDLPSLYNTYGHNSGTLKGVPTVNGLTGQGTTAAGGLLPTNLPMVGGKSTPQSYTYQTTGFDTNAAENAAALKALASNNPKPLTGDIKPGSATRPTGLLGDLVSSLSDPYYQTTTNHTINLTAPTAPQTLNDAVTQGTPGSPTPADGLADVTTNGKGYVNPVEGDTVRWERTDQGVDAALGVGQPIRAIGDAKVIGIIGNWYSGQPLVWYKLLSGPDAGKYVYVAEQINPTVHAGQVVKAGQPIATYASSGTGIETGWAEPSGETVARATTGYTEGQATPAGSSFRNLLKSLGAHVG